MDIADIIGSELNYRFTNSLRIGDRVASLRWLGTRGTVSNLFDGRIFVRWDGTSFEDEVAAAEIDRTAE